MTNRLNALNKLLSPLLAAGFLLHTGAALAAGSASDAQTQAREMLRGNLARSSKQGVQPGPAVDPSGAASGSDAQLGARLLLLGNPNPSGTRSNTLQVNAVPGPGFPGKRGRHAHSDAQEQAQRLIQGGAV